MKLITSSLEADPLEMVGGKGHQLQKLIKWGAPVPPFIILTTNSYREYSRTGSIPKEVLDSVNQFIQQNESVSLRSSMVGEDSLDASFAGMFETILNVKSENWVEALLKVYASVKSDRVKEYLDKKSIKSNLQMAVVVQKMISCDISGVLFTRSPVNPTSALAIDVALGLGEGVVSGHVDVDHYQFTRSQDLIFKISKHEYDVITTKEMKELIDLSLVLEGKANHPSDIEWGFFQNKLYIFQIRPITRAFEPLTHYVDTNLSESYPGTVSPFTAAFVKKAYENVFRESAILMGAEGERLRKLSYHYERLISCVDNHLYYNLEHYYAVLRALPGGEKNISDWHRMIGGSLKTSTIPYHETKLSPFETFYTVLLLLKMSLNHKKIFSSFSDKLENLQRQIEEEIREATDSSSSINLLNVLINRPLGFGLTVVNDVFIMIGLGYLSKSLKKRGYPEEAVIDLIKTSHGVDSLKPLEAFESVIDKLSETFVQMLKAANLKAGVDPYADIFKQLSSKGFETEVNLLQNFLKDYGDRSFEELKLESLPLKNNPKLLIQLISWGKKNEKVISLPKAKTTSISFGFLGNKILNFTREAIAVRESTRLWRGKFYHFLRRLVLQLATQLQTNDSKWQQFEIEDFFSLSHLEWLEFADNKVNADQVFDKIKSRRNWKNNQRHFPESIIWSESESLPTIDHQSEHQGLSGQGVSPGTMEAQALVLDKPDEALVSDLQDFILVTKNTDPAWVYIMSRSKGLISEKGSLLSHTAIIGRELGVPTIVGVKAATQKIKTGDLLKIDAQKGTIEII